MLTLYATLVLRKEEQCYLGTTAEPYVNQALKPWKPLVVCLVLVCQICNKLGSKQTRLLLNIETH